MRINNEDTLLKILFDPLIEKESISSPLTYGEKRLNEWYKEFQNHHYQYASSELKNKLNSTEKSQEIYIENTLGINNSESNDFLYLGSDTIKICPFTDIEKAVKSIISGTDINNQANLAFIIPLDKIKGEFLVELYKTA